MSIGPCQVVTGGPAPRVLEDGAVRVVGAHVAQVGTVGSIAAAYVTYPHMGPVLPALGYSAEQRRELVETIAAETGLPVGIKSAVGEAPFWPRLKPASRPFSVKNQYLRA